MASNKKEIQQKADFKRAGERTRNWTVVLYPEDLPLNWREILDEKRFKWIESPLHDQDLNADGTPKKPHHHAIFMFSSVKTYDQLKGLLKMIFGESETGSIIGVANPQKVADRGALVRYFAHLDHPDKAQYSINDIVGHNGADPTDVMKYSRTEKQNLIIEMEEFIEEHNITELCDLSRAIRYAYPEWHYILTTEKTTFFCKLLDSLRNKAKDSKGGIAREPIFDEITGELIE